MRHNAKPANLLLVEDDPSHAELIRMSLDHENIGNTVNHVANGADAINYLRRDPPYTNAIRPDVILLDLKLPKLDGHQVLEQIKNDDSLRSIPVVVLTTSSNTTDRTRAYSHHANSYLTKPVDFQELRQLVRGLEKYWTIWNERPVADT